MALHDSQFNQKAKSGTMGPSSRNSTIYRPFWKVCFEVWYIFKMTEADIVQMVKNDEWMMSVLRHAEKLNLPDWIIGAGFLRNKVWDYLHGITREKADTNDIDLVYFDDTHIDEENDKKLSERMKGVLGLDWEIVNQAYTHKWHNRDTPYTSTAEGLSEWVETPTCVGVTLVNEEPVIIAPHGIDDLVHLIVRPSPAQANNLEIFYKRIEAKRWLHKWPKLKVVVE